MSVRPLILDFDDSVLQFSSDEIRIPLQDWQERIRFGCSKGQYARFKEQINFPEDYGCVFMGSGDYHHVSLLLLEKAAEKGERFDVVVCDNHPDNMRYPFGIHCGSWVYHASKVPGVERIHVVGITSDDITAWHCWENHLSPLRNGKVVYWSVGKNVRWLDWLGAKTAHRDFDTPDALMDALTGLVNETRNIYLSIDKDVFGKDVVETNWDQGCFAFRHMDKLLAACRSKLVGMDVAGEISGYRFRGLFKKMLTKWDGLEEPEPSQLKNRQEKQRSINEMIMGVAFP